MSTSPNPLAAAHQAAQHAAQQAAQQQAAQQAAQQSVHPYQIPQYYSLGVQTSPWMMSSAYHGKMMSTQTSPVQTSYADTQTSPRPMVPPTPGPVVFGPSPASSSYRSSRSSCRYGYTSADDQVCERCGENSWVTREQYFVLRMRRKAARFAMKYQSQSTPPQSGYYTPNVSLMASRGGYSGASMPRPAPRPAHQPLAAVSPSAWRPWTEQPSMDYQNIRARAEAAIRAHRHVQTTREVTSTYTKEEPTDKEEK